MLTVERGPQYEIIATFHCASAELAGSLTAGGAGEIDEGVSLGGVDHQGNVVAIPNIMFSELTLHIDADVTDIETAGPPAWSNGQSAWDYLLIPVGSDRQAAVCVVPKTFGPSWSSGLAIEYRNGWGGFASTDDREAIADVLGFLFGRHSEGRNDGA